MNCQSHYPWKVACHKAVSYGLSYLVSSWAIYHLYSGIVYLKATLMKLNSISLFECKTGQNRSLSSMVIPSEFLIGASIIVFFWTQKRHSSCYPEVAKFSLTPLKSVCRCWGMILYPQKLLKILTLHLIRTSHLTITSLKLFRPVCPALLKSFPRIQ